MNQMLMNHVVMDIDSTKQYLDLASRTMMRAIGSSTQRCWRIPLHDLLSFIQRRTNAPIC